MTDRQLPGGMAGCLLVVARQQNGLCSGSADPCEGFGGFRAQGIG